MRKKKPNKNYVFSILSYDPESGNLFWLESRGSILIGSLAGTDVNSRGKIYRYIKIDKNLYKAHHLAWLFQHGEWPSFDLDHIDGDGTNNRIANLRKCTMSQNKANSKIYKNNKSGAKGVHKRANGKYYVSVQHKGKRIFIGVYLTLKDAAVAYWSAAKAYHGGYARAS